MCYFPDVVDRVVLARRCGASVVQVFDAENGRAFKGHPTEWHESAIRAVTVVPQHECRGLVGYKDAVPLYARDLPRTAPVIVSVEARCQVCVSDWETGNAIRLINMNVCGIMDSAALSDSTATVAVSLGLAGSPPYIGTTRPGVVSAAPVVTPSSRARRRAKLLRRIGSYASTGSARSGLSASSEAHSVVDVQTDVIYAAEAMVAPAPGLRGRHDEYDADGVRRKGSGSTSSALRARRDQPLNRSASMASMVSAGTGAGTGAGAGASPDPIAAAPRRSSDGPLAAKARGSPARQRLLKGGGSARTRPKSGGRASRLRRADSGGSAAGTRLLGRQSSGRSNRGDSGNAPHGSRRGSRSGKLGWEAGLVGGGPLSRKPSSSTLVSTASGTSARSVMRDRGNVPTCRCVALGRNLDGTQLAGAGFDDWTVSMYVQHIAPRHHALLRFVTT